MAKAVWLLQATSSSAPWRLHTFSTMEKTSIPRLRWPTGMALRVWKLQAPALGV